MQHAAQEHGLKVIIQRYFPDDAVGGTPGTTIPILRPVSCTPSTEACHKRRHFGTAASQLIVASLVPKRGRVTPVKASS